MWGQMQVDEVTRAGLLKPPLIFAAVGVLGFGIGPVPDTRAALGYLAVSAALSIGLGLWRGALLPLWTDADGRTVARVAVAA